MIFSFYVTDIYNATL